MATIASILRDGEDPSMPALRAWLSNLNSSVSAAAGGFRTFTNVAALNAYTPGVGQPTYAFVTEPVLAAYKFTGALPWVADPSYYDGVAAAVQPVIDGLSGSVSANAAALDAINNGYPPARITESTANDFHLLFRTDSFVQGRTYRYSGLVTPNGRTKFAILNTSGFLNFTASFDTQALTASGPGASISDQGDGTYLVAAEAVAAATGSANTQLRLRNSAGVEQYAGDGDSGIFIGEILLKENGTLIRTARPSDMVSSQWTKSGVSVALSTSNRFPGLAQKVSALATGSALPLAGIPCAVLGTSLVEQDKFTAPLRAMSGMPLTNLGASGKTLGRSATTNETGILDKIALIPLNTKLVLLEAGINDFLQNVPLGALGDKTDATFYGAVYQAAIRIEARVPLAVGVFASTTTGGGNKLYGDSVTGPEAVNGIGLQPRHYQQAMQDVCLWLSQPFEDIGRDAGVGHFTGNETTGDGLHYDDDGGDIIAMRWYDGLLERVRRGIIRLMNAQP